MRASRCARAAARAVLPLPASLLSPSVPHAPPLLPACLPLPFLPLPWPFSLVPSLSPTRSLPIARWQGDTGGCAMHARRAPARGLPPLAAPGACRRSWSCPRSSVALAALAVLDALHVAAGAFAPPPGATVGARSGWPAQAAGRACRGGGGAPRMQVPSGARTVRLVVPDGDAQAQAAAESVASLLGSSETNSANCWRVQASTAARAQDEDDSAALYVWAPAQGMFRLRSQGCAQPAGVLPQWLDPFNEVRRRVRRRERAAAGPLCEVHGEARRVLGDHPRHRTRRGLTRGGWHAQEKVLDTNGWSFLSPDDEEPFSPFDLDAAACQQAYVPL